MQLVFSYLTQLFIVGYQERFERSWFIVTIVKSSFLWFILYDELIDFV